MYKKNIGYNINCKGNIHIFYIASIYKKNMKNQFFSTSGQDQKYADLNKTS